MLEMCGHLVCNSAMKGLFEMKRTTYEALA